MRWGLPAFAFACVVVGCSELLGVDELHDRGDAADATAPDASDAGDEPDVLEGCALALPTNVCAAFPQCGCDAGHNCTVYDTTGKTRCVLPSTTPLYTLCTGSCPIGAQCIGGVCKPYCATDSDCPRLDGGVSRACLQITATGFPSGPPVPGLKTCTSGCDLVNPAGLCGSNVQCAPLMDDNGDPRPDCGGPAGTAIGPGTCTTPQPTFCAPGYACLDGTGPNPLACSKYCRLNNAAQDCGSLACVAFSPPIIVDSIEYGSCN